MADGIELAATLVAVVTTIAALVTLWMELLVVSGTFFMVTAIAIYIRETKG